MDRGECKDGSVPVNVLDVIGDASGKLIIAIAAALTDRKRHAVI